MRLLSQVMRARPSGLRGLTAQRGRNGRKQELLSTKKNQKILTREASYNWTSRPLLPLAPSRARPLRELPEAELTFRMSKAQFLGNFPGALR
jgi:hypothetical protein